MKFSAWLSSANPWPDLLDEAQHVAASGWDGVWIADHFMPSNREYETRPTQEVWSVLAGLGALVPRVRLGSLVTGNTYRNPGVLAKQVAQVDLISGGRAVLGLGAGWQENEHVAYGIPYPGVGGRLHRLEEAVQIIRSLFDNERTTFEGRFYSFHEAPLSPKPVQPHLPILIGGSGEKLTMGIAARFADEWNTWGLPDFLAGKGEVLERHCAAIERDPAEIRRSAQAVVTISNDAAVLERARATGGFPVLAGSLEQVRDAMGRYRDAGVDEFIVPDFYMGRTVEQRKEALDRFMEDVAAAFR